LPATTFLTEEAGLDIQHDSGWKFKVQGYYSASADTFVKGGKASLTIPLEADLPAAFAPPVDKALVYKAPANKALVYKALPVLVVHDWTGLYFGGNIGYGWGRSSDVYNVRAPNIFDPTCPPGAALCLSGSNTSSLNAPIGGIQAGYNRQVGRFVAGFELDMDMSGQKANQLFNLSETIPAGPFFGFPPATVIGTSTAYSEKLSWLGTLRGRVGVTADRLLFYATGGLAYGVVTNDGSATTTGVQAFAFLPPCPAGLCPLANWNSGQSKIGWTFGAGIEGALTSHWSVKFEYLHVDLGSVSRTFVTFPGCFGSPAWCYFTAPGSATISSRVTSNMVRVGVNYNFDGRL